MFTCRALVFLSIAISIGIMIIAATPSFAQRRGGGGGFDFSSIPDMIGGMRDLGGGGGKDYSNTPEVPFRGGCRIVNEPLYDDNDHVVARQRVKECPIAPTLANCRVTNKPVYDSHDKVVAHQRIQQCPAQ